MVPTGLRPGFYELTAEVWPANQIGFDELLLLQDHAFRALQPRLSVLIPTCIATVLPVSGLTPRSPAFPGAGPDRSHRRVRGLLR
ncbi:MAG: hypothetical protein ACRDS1_09195 [Pseudonocardiaceae bacterium]